MKSLIVCTSVSHGSTRRVADVIGSTLDAPVIAPGQVDPADLAAQDLVGFGSGIFTRKFHPDLRALIDSLPQVDGTKAFVFATSGFPDAGLTAYSSALADQLARKGFDVIDAFSCRAHDTWFPFKPFGGLHKDRPNADDLEQAATFAEGLQHRLATTH